MRSLFDFDWYRFFTRLCERTFEAEIFDRAAQVAFYFSFAIFPLLYFLVSLFGLVIEASEGLRGELFSYLKQILPSTVFDLVRKTIDEIVQNSSGGKATLGLVITLWSASVGVDSLRSALNATYKLKETRLWPRTKLESLIITFVISLLAALVLAIVFYGWQLFQMLLANFGLQITSPLVLIAIQWISALVVMLFACEIIYNLLPNFKKFRWTWITPGSIVAVVLWLIATGGFRLYVSYFNSYNKAYGSLGAVIIMMLWLYLTATAVMIGGLINSVLHEMHETHETHEPED